MFTGIIEATGAVRHITREGTNADFWIEAPFAAALQVDQSIAHNGACLTVVAIEEALYRVTAVAETLQKTTLATWQIGDAINLERALVAGSRLDGHFVQGHVDATAVCRHIAPQEGSWLLTFGYDAAFAHLIIEKGSVCLNGVSLTCFNLVENTFQVAVIPYTWQHTNLSQLQPGSRVNIEFDLLGKYISRRAEVGEK